MARLLAKHGKRALVVSDLDGLARRSANRVLIDASGIRGFSNVKRRGRRWLVGAGATFGDVLREVEGENGLLKQAVSMTANPLVRNRVIVLTALDPESEYFDLATALVALDGRVHVHSTSGSRVMPIESFLLAAAEGLRPGEFPSAIEFQTLDSQWRVGFFRVNPGQGKPTVSAAVRTRLRRNVAIEPLIVVSSSTIIPVLAPAASKALAGLSLIEPNVTRIAELAAGEMLEIADLGEDPYESSLIQVAVSRALRRINEIPRTLSP